MSHGCQTYLRSNEVGVASLAYVYDMALHDTATNHIGCDGEPGICICYGLGTQETERSSMSHMDDVIGMMAYLGQHTDGRDDRGRYGVQGSCNHLEQTMRDVCLSGSSRIVSET